MYRLLLLSSFRRVFQNTPTNPLPDTRPPRSIFGALLTRQRWLPTLILLALLVGSGTTQQVVPPDDGPSIPVSS